MLGQVGLIYTEGDFNQICENIYFQICVSRFTFMGKLFSYPHKVFVFIFIPQQNTRKKFHTPVKSLPPRYMLYLMTAP